MSDGTALARQRYARVREGFAAAMRWAPGERAAVVAALAEEDAEVAAEVASLLAHVVEQREPGQGAEQGAELGAEQGAELGERQEPWSLAQVLERMDELVAEAVGTVRAADRLREENAVRPPDSPGDAAQPLEDGGARPAAVAGDVRPPDSADEAGEAAPPLWTCATAAAVAPEELEPALGPRGPWSEVYALALVVRARLLGEPVAAGASVAALLRRARRDDAAPTLHELEVAPEVAAVLAAALARRPVTRTQSVARFRAQLMAAAASEQGAAAGEQTAPASPASARRARPSRRASSSASLAVFVVVIVLGLAAAAVSLWR